MKITVKKVLSSIIILIVILSVSTLYVNAEPYDKNTDVIAGKYGIFIHYTAERIIGVGSSIEAWNEAVNSFDAEKFAVEAEKIGAAWVGITVSAGVGFACCPVPALEEITGMKCGSDRDLIADLYKALNPKNIKIMLYMQPGAPPANTPMAKKLGAAFVRDSDLVGGQTSGNWLQNWTVAKNIAIEMQELSERYGDKVFAWWIDSCYDNLDYNERLAKLQSDALRSGNSNAIVAFNKGLENEDCTYEYESYTCGEKCNPHTLSKETFLDFSADSRWTASGYQRHFLTFLGTNWGYGGLTYNTDEFAKHCYNNILKNGAALTLDMYCDATGAFDTEQLQQMVAFKNYIDSQPEITVESAVKSNSDRKSDVEDSVIKKETIIEYKYNWVLYIVIACMTILIAIAIMILLFKLRKSSMK